VTLTLRACAEWIGS